METHDFTKFPELTNGELAAHIKSPHAQITEDIRTLVVKVHDADTITVRWRKRDFDFPVRFLDIDAPELNENKGKTAQRFLANRILGKEVWLRIRKENRVDKWGRLLAIVEYMGLNLNELMMTLTIVKPFAQRHEGEIQTIREILK